MAGTPMGQTPLDDGRLEPVTLRLARDFLKYLPALTTRHALPDVIIKAEMHAGQFLKVEHAVQTQFQLGKGGKTRLDATDLATTGSASRPVAQTQTLPREVINARIGLRLRRLMQHCTLQFAKLVIHIVDGTVQTIRVKLTMRPDEMLGMAVDRDGGLRLAGRHGGLDLGGSSTKPKVTCRPRRRRGRNRKRRTRTTIH